MQLLGLFHAAASTKSDLLNNLSCLFMPPVPPAHNPQIELQQACLVATQFLAGEDKAIPIYDNDNPPATCKLGARLNVGLTSLSQTAAGGGEGILGSQRVPY